MARREKAGIDGGWIGKDPARIHEGWRTAVLPHIRPTMGVDVIDSDDFILYYAVNEDDTISAYWRKDRIGFVR